MNRCDRGFNDSYDKGRNRSRSPAGWGDRHKSSGCDCSRSRSADRHDSAAGRSPVHSFHEVMMKRGQLSPLQQRGPSQKNLVD